MPPFSPAAGPPGPGPRRLAGQPSADSPADPPGLDPAAVRERFRKARERRSGWEGLWQECYDFALPQRGGVLEREAPGGRRTDRLFDGTAPDAVDQLAASLLAHLTPPWSRWIGFVPGPDLPEREHDAVGPALEAAAEVLHGHLDRSNFAVEVHQCFLDLVVGGTASLLVEEAPPGEPSAFRFTAVPLPDAVLEEGPDGRLDVAFRRTEATRDQLERRFPGLVLPDRLARDTERDPRRTIALVEAVLPEPPRSGSAYRWMVLFEDGDADEPPVARGRFAHAPFVNFRWLKAPGEIYGRSPVMKALPDIKTANKVVELVLKNASIAVTGIWQADDDGVLNPAAVKLTPGTIIPKAVGSAGLTPLEAPGKFDVSQLVLEDMRARIRHALLADQLAQIHAPRMTATEVLERAGQMARLLGATYGRLQTELVVPLVRRCLDILTRRGEIDALPLDGRLVDLQHRSPLAQSQGQRDAQGTLAWLQTALALGPEAAAAVDAAAAARWLGERFGVPAELMRAPPDPTAPPAALDPSLAPIGDPAATWVDAALPAETALTVAPPAAAPVRPAASPAAGGGHG